MLAEFWLRLRQDRGGVSRFLFALGKFSAGKVERRVCVVYSRWLRQYFCSRVDGLVPAAFRRILFKRPWCLFDFCPCPRKSPLSQDGSSLLGTCVHVKSLYWSEGYTFQRQGAEVDACAAHSWASLGIRVLKCFKMHFYHTTLSTEPRIANCYWFSLDLFAKQISWFGNKVVKMYNANEFTTHTYCHN